jgi:sensor domain CHASE-containing protein/HAMP domain-containing protein
MDRRAGARSLVWLPKVNAMQAKKAGTSSSLNRKVMLVLGAVIVILLLGNGAIFGLVFWPAFIDFEKEAAEKNVSRVADAIEKEQGDLERVARDWSAWDPTYEYVVAPNEEYERQSFTFDVMRDLNLNLIALYDIDGQRVRTQAFDFATGEEIEISRFGAGFASDDPFLPHVTPDAHVAGILLTEHGPMLLAGFPLVQSTREGPYRGSLFMGRLVSPEMIEGLKEQTHVQFEVFRTDVDDLAPDLRSALDELAQGAAQAFDDSTKDVLLGYQLLPTLQDAQPLLLRVETLRRISGIGRTTLAVAGLSTVVTGLLIMAAIWLMLNRHIVAPLNRLTRHVLEVGQTGDLTRRMAIERDDEIGLLAREFDAAATQLDNARRRLLEQSYQSGMAEIAAGVMHNIRNALSPVAVSLWKLSETAMAAPASHLDEALRELKADSTPAERRAKLVEYLEAALTKVRQQGQYFAGELKLIAEQNRHIEQVLQDHTALSMGIRQLEPVNLSRIVGEATRFIPAKGDLRIDVKVAPELARLPDVHGNPIVLTQILGNLMINAAEAIAERGTERGNIEIRAAVEEENGQSFVHLAVSDNGNGIDPVNIGNMFERGFSTKKGKTGGLGLHWSANSVAAMAGRMYAESSGRGAGASIHIVLPVAPGLADLAA